MSSLQKMLTGSILMALLFPGTLLSAKPFPEEQRLPLDLRRTTLVVRDLDQSLALYRDALGMRMAYENFIRTPREATTDDAADRSLHLAFLQANDDFIGVLGLLEYRKPRKEQPRSELAFEPGTIVLVFNVQDLDERWGQVIAVPGVEVISEPEQTNYPSYDGQGVIPVMVSVIRDPDGFIIELNQLLVEELY
ncbi:MAG: VOC family protein [Congregibacter sp.]